MIPTVTILLVSAASVTTMSDVLRGAAVASAAGALVVVWRAFRRLRRTTLAAPCAWAVGSLAAVLADVAVGDIRGPATASHLHYLAAVSTLAPFVALLGAKRPQNRAWQWIVAALLLLLALQSLKAIVIDHGAPPTPHLAWRSLLAVLLAASWVNYLPTRNCGAATLIFAGQICLLADYLPLAGSWEPRAAWGLIMLAAGVLAAAVQAKRQRASPAAPTEGPFDTASLDRVWLDFRDAYGALWALRVAERMNAAARQYGWPLHLSWRGFQPLDAQRTSDRQTEEALDRAFRAILSRFVDAAWWPS